LRAECYATMEQWNDAYMDQKKAISLVLVLGEDSLEYGVFQLNLMRYASNNGDDKSVLDSAAIYYSYLMRASHALVYAADEGDAALALIERAVLAVSPWVLQSRIRQSFDSARASVDAKSRIEFGVIVWWGLIKAVIANLAPSEASEWEEKLVWLKNYTEALEDVTALALIAPGPPSINELKERFTVWVSRGTVSLVLRGGEPEDWAVPYTQRAPLFAVRVVQALLLPYLVKAREKFLAGPGNMKELATMSLDLIAKIESRCKQLLAGEQGELEKRDNETRLRLVEEWRTTINQVTNVTEEQMEALRQAAAERATGRRASLGEQVPQSGGWGALANNVDTAGSITGAAKEALQKKEVSNGTVEI